MTLPRLSDLAPDTAPATDGRVLLPPPAEAFAEEDAPPPDDADAPDDAGSLEGAVFGATDLLGQIRTAARARLVSPWAVLGCVLARVVAATPPHYVLPPVIGSQATLNLAVALVGPPGAGKSLADGCAADLLRATGAHVHKIGPGTGEGIMATFLQWDATEQALELVNSPCAYLYADEIAQIDAIGTRSGATFGPIIRSMLSGVEVGTQNADPARRRHLARHTYRLALVAGVQPALAGILLGDADAGTPQRWLWLPADDPGIPDAEPDWPGEITWTLPVAGRSAATRNGRVEVALPPGAAELVKGEHRKRQRGDGEGLDGHALLTRMKTAAALALLHGGTGIEPLHWRLAGLVMAKSDATRAGCEAAVTVAREAENRARGRMDAARAEGAREADSANNVKLARLLHRTVANPDGHANSKHEPGAGCTRRCLTFALRNHPAADKDAVISAASDLDWITEESGRWRPGGSAPAEVNR